MLVIDTTGRAHRDGAGLLHEGGRREGNRGAPPGERDEDSAGGENRTSKEVPFITLEHDSNSSQAFELEISKELTNLSDKYIAHHKNEVLEIRQKMTYDHEAKLSKQKNDFEDVIRSLKEEVDDALRKIKAKEQVRVCVVVAVTDSSANFSNAMQ